MQRNIHFFLQEEDRISVKLPTDYVMYPTATEPIKKMNFRRWSCKIHFFLKEDRISVKLPADDVMYPTATEPIKKNELQTRV